jgi:hypothetical protein
MLKDFTSAGRPGSPFILDELSFDPEIKSVMSQAFVSACKALGDVGQPEMVNTVLAKRIIAIAKTGERDPNRLCDRALQAFGLRPQ